MSAFELIKHLLFISYLGWQYVNMSSSLISSRDWARLTSMNFLKPHCLIFFVSEDPDRVWWILSCTKSSLFWSKISVRIFFSSLTAESSNMMELLTGTVPVNKLLLARTVLVNKLLLAGTVLVNKFLLAGTPKKFKCQKNSPPPQSTT